MKNTHKILRIFAFCAMFWCICGIDFAFGKTESSETKKHQEYLRTSKNKSGKRETPPNESSEALPNANDFLQFFESNLEKRHKEILQHTLDNRFLRFRGYSLIDYSVYKNLSWRERHKIKKPLVFFRGFLDSAPLYSEQGGVSVYARLASDESVRVYLNFQPRYFSDLQTIMGNGRKSERETESARNANIRNASKGRFYALCALPKINRCLLLGIGEKW
ncbi:hypothetical protein [Helicobacter sp. T3_23-1056]